MHYANRWRSILSVIALIVYTITLLVTCYKVEKMQEQQILIIQAITLLSKNDSLLVRTTGSILEIQKTILPRSITFLTEKENQQ